MRAELDGRRCKRARDARLAQRIAAARAHRPRHINKVVREIRWPADGSRLASGRRPGSAGQPVSGTAADRVAPGAYPRAMQDGRVPRWLVGLLAAQTIVIVGAMVLMDAQRAAPAAPADGIDWSEVTRPSHTQTAVPWTARPTLRPISSPELTAYCDDPATSAAWADVWNAEAAARRAIGAADPEAQAEAEAWVTAARVAAAVAEASRPLPVGWGGPGDDEGSRLALDLLCMARERD